MVDVLLGRNQCSLFYSHERIQIYFPSSSSMLLYGFSCVSWTFLNCSSACEYFLTIVLHDHPPYTACALSQYQQRIWIFPRQTPPFSTSVFMHLIQGTDTINNLANRLSSSFERTAFSLLAQQHFHHHNFAQFIESSSANPWPRQKPRKEAHFNTHSVWQQGHRRSYYHTSRFFVSLQDKFSVELRMPPFSSAYSPALSSCGWFWFFNALHCDAICQLH